MSLTIYNSTYVFANTGYTDINIFIVLAIFAVLFLFFSRYLSDNFSKFIFACLTFTFFIGLTYFSANVATYIVNPQFSELTNLTTNVTNHMYNQSIIEVIPENSPILSLLMIIMTLISFLNLIEILYSMFGPENEVLPS